MRVNIASTLSPPKTVNVLVVEDEYILARNLKESLETFGYTVVDIADSGETAIECALRLRPTIVLMDIRIRGEVDGIEAAEYIWQQLQIPVIYVTGHSDQTTVERATLTLPFGYILKPIREQELYVAIQTALSRYGHEQFFTTVLQGMGDAVVVADAQMHLKYLNAAAEDLTGWALSDAKEHPVNEVLSFLDEHDHSPIEHPMLTALQKQATVYLNENALLVRKDGSTLPVADSVALLKNNEGAVTGAVLVFRDDTQRRLLAERDRAHERIQFAETQLAEQARLNQLKDEFLTTTSHELRTPLSNIKLVISLLEMVLNRQGALQSVPAEQAQAVNRYLSVLQDQCDQQLNLVNDLLEMRALDAGICPLALTAIQLQDWLPQIGQTFQERVNAQQQTLRMSIPTELPAITADLSGLTRIVTELLNNACKYTPAGGTIEVMAGIRLDSPSASVQIIIRNSGAEISAEQQMRLFDPFYRIPHGDLRNQGGTGLGLALVKKLVTCLQGTIDLTSDQDWTTFTLQLPLHV